MVSIVEEVVADIDSRDTVAIAENADLVVAYMKVVVLAEARTGHLGFVVAVIAGMPEYVEDAGMEHQKVLLD